jgi:hypothetical protein
MGWKLLFALEKARIMIIASRSYWKEKTEDRTFYVLQQPIRRIHGEIIAISTLLLQPGGHPILSPLLPPPRYPFNLGISFN